MRLIDTSSLTLHEFSGADTPKYCILSHRWEETGEVSFKDLQAGIGPELKGYSKVLGCCKQAVLDGWKYAWIDSCCIDKWSSAELPEAINSMFLWYREAQVCYAYLSDVPSIKGCNEHTTNLNMAQSKWFTRGWTLQELLAPEYVVFYDENWDEIGTKASLADVIQRRTGIKDLRRWEEACVAQKMSWAAWRQTTRVEDLAYSLLGIFGVYMPPLYGEGNNAFLRLQLEIVNRSGDESIFAWTDTLFLNTTGVFANSPQNFHACGDIEVIKGPNAMMMYREKPYTITNLGLRLEDALVQADLKTIKKMVKNAVQPCQIEDLGFDYNPSSKENLYIMPLNCTIPAKDRSTTTASGPGRLCLALILEKTFGDHFVVLRYDIHRFVTTPVRRIPQKLAFVTLFIPTVPYQNPEKNFMIEAPVSDSQVTYLGSHTWRSGSMSWPPGFNPDWKPVWTVAEDQKHAQKFGINDGTSRRLVTVVIESQDSPGIHLLRLEASREMEMEKTWNSYCKSSLYRQGNDRCSMALSDGAIVFASLKRTQDADFRVEIKILNSDWIQKKISES